MNVSIFFKGSWEPTDVTVIEIQSSRLIETKLEEACQKEWGTKLATAKAQNRMLWDSEIYRFEQVSQKPDKQLVLHFSTIPFSIRLGMNEHTGMVKSLGNAYAPRGLFTSVLLKTADDYLVFIEKSDKYFTSKKYSWVGGILSKSESVLKSGVDLFIEVEKEILEETGTQKEHLMHAPLLRAGYLTENWNVCLLFEQSITLTREELLSVFNASGSDETKNLLLIHPQDLPRLKSLFEVKDQEKFAILGLI